MINMKTTADKIDDISVQLKISINQVNPKQPHRKKLRPQYPESESAHAGTMTAANLPGYSHQAP